ncbi:MAG TPA: DUF1156 domain-containing protein, partial [Actinomycetota bacterium]|nr:DUF1156 domain-containing protein [Actinomycetota bacterium]
MSKRPPVLIERWLPVAELGIESRREAAPIPGQFPKLKTLHVWWARRPLVASAAAVLGSLMPAWSEDLARQFPDSEHLRSEKAYKEWFLRLCGIWGDPVAAKKKLAAANTRGEKLPDGGYGYRQAFRKSPPLRDLLLLHRLFLHSWGDAPVMLDPTAGGGSIPYESVRYGIEARSNDLNPVAALVMRAGLWFPVSYGPDLIFQVRTWG